MKCLKIQIGGIIMKKTVIVMLCLVCFAVLPGCGGTDVPDAAGTATTGVDTGAGTGTGTGDPVGCGNGVVDVGEVCDDGNNNMISGQDDYCSGTCMEISRMSVNALMQRDCPSSFEAVFPGDGEDMAAASCGPATVVLAGGVYGTTAAEYDCPAVVSLTQRYLFDTGTVLADYFAQGVNYASLCAAIDDEVGLGITCAVAAPVAGQEAAWMLQQLAAGNVIILNLKPYKNGSGQVIAAEGHYILINGYTAVGAWADVFDGHFLATDPAGTGGDALNPLAPFQNNAIDIEMLMEGVEKHFLLITYTGK